MFSKKYIILVLSLIILAGCTHTRVVSFKDPDAYNKVYDHIAIIGNVEDLSDRLAIEEKMVETLRKSGVRAVSSLYLLPPTRNYTVEEEFEIYNKNSIDALAVIQIADAGFFVSSEPFSVHTESDDDGSETTFSGGGTEQKAFGKLRISLIDATTDKTMWIGDADAQSFFDTIDPDWDMNYLLKASSKKIAKELIKTGLVRVSN